MQGVWRAAVRALQAADNAAVRQQRAASSKNVQVILARRLSNTCAERISRLSAVPDKRPPLPYLSQGR